MMKYLFALTYILVLATQLPHVWAVYASMERGELVFGPWTAVGAAVAFELATGLFTYRLVAGSRRRWTRWGLYAFLLASVVANLAYYRVWVGFERAVPWLAAFMLPFGLFVFAEEFGVEARADARRARREQSRRRAAGDEQPEEKASVELTQRTLVCKYPGCSYSVAYPGERYPNVRSARAALAGHARTHHNGRGREQTAVELAVELPPVSGSK